MRFAHGPISENDLRILARRMEGPMTRLEARRLGELCFQCASMEAKHGRFSECRECTEPRSSIFCMSPLWLGTE